MHSSISIFSSSSRNWSPVKQAQQAKRPPSDPGALPLGNLNTAVDQMDQAFFRCPLCVTRLFAKGDTHHSLGQRPRNWARDMPQGPCTRLLDTAVGQTDRALFSSTIMCYPAFSPKAILIIAWGNAPVIRRSQERLDCWSAIAPSVDKSQPDRPTRRAFPAGLFAPDLAPGSYRHSGWC